MKKYEFLDHTADAKFLAYGKDLEDAFKSCALATTVIMTDIDKVEKKIEKKIEVTSNKKRSLLYDFLEELIFYLDTEGFLLAEVKELQIKKNNETYSLSATILGDSSDKYEILTAIKAVTYSDMFIKEEPNLTTIQVVHDL